MVDRNNKSRKNSRENENFSAASTENWKQSFLEVYLRDYLEKIKPEEYSAEKIKELADLCGDYVRKLEIREMQCSENSSNRIPLNAIVTGLKYLTELSLCFKQTYVGEDFRWNILKVSLEDVKLLAKGLKKCKLSSFRCMFYFFYYYYYNTLSRFISYYPYKSIHNLQNVSFTKPWLGNYKFAAIRKFRI